MIKNNMDLLKENKYILRYFFIIFLFFGSILSGTIGVLYNLESKDYLQRLELEEHLNLKIQLRLINTRFEGIVSDLLFLSKQNELMHLINNNETKYISWISNEYLELIKKKGIYDQIRYIDKTGMEIVRVNYNRGNPKIVKQSGLQFKGDRYYFKDSFSLGQNEIFVSPFDLNIEKGKVEKPLKPMIRFGVPVFDNRDRKRGIIVVNFLGNLLIDSINETSKLSLGDIMLVNSDGYWICSPNEEDEWGFMIKGRDQRKFPSLYPESWNKIISSKSCQIYNRKGLFTSATIYPLGENLKSSTGSHHPYGDSEKKIKSSEYYWKIISHIPKTNLNSGTRGLLVKLFILAFLLFLLGAIPSWIIAKALVRRKLLQLKLYRSANYDKLTDLPNRSLFGDRLNQIVKESTRYHRKFALMFIDLDGFKSVNDIYGHDSGDRVLIQTAKRLLHCVRSSDTVARVGGDEFVIILPSVSESENIEMVAGKIISYLSKPFKIKDSEITIGASIGISCYPENGVDVETLFKKADEAMYRAKKSGKNDYRFSSSN